MSLVDFSAGQFEKFLLILMRVGGMMLVAPFFGHRNIPALVKIGFIVIFTLILVPIIPSPAINLDGNILAVSTIAAKEILCGLAMGFAAMVLFLAVQTAGQIIGFQIGFAIVDVIDPSSSQSISVISEFQYIVAILIFLAIDGHHLLINAVVQSFGVVPLGAVTFTPLSADILTRICVEVFAIAIKIGAPVIVTLFLTDVALGIIARTVPQMNVFIVAFPLKIGAGLLMLAASIPFFNYVFTKLVQSMDKDLIRLMASLKGAA